MVKTCQRKSSQAFLYTLWVPTQDIWLGRQGSICLESWLMGLSLFLPKKMELLGNSCIPLFPLQGKSQEWAEPSGQLCSGWGCGHGGWVGVGSE